MTQFRQLALVAALVMPCTFAHAADTTLDFNGLGLPDYGVISGTYGSNAANTPNIGVSYRSFNTTNNSTVAPNLLLWNTGYGDLNNIAFASQNGLGAEITLTPDPGYAVTLGSFDLAGYFQSNLTASFIRVVDATNTPVWSSGSSTVLGIGPSHSSYSPGITSTGPLKIQFGTNWDIGIDNVRFSQSSSSVPEPGTLALGLLPGAFVFLRFRKRRAL